MRLKKNQGSAATTCTPSIKPLNSVFTRNTLTVWALPICILPMCAFSEPSKGKEASTISSQTYTELAPFLDKRPPFKIDPAASRESILPPPIVKLRNSNKPYSTNEHDMPRNMARSFHDPGRRPSLTWTPNDVGDAILTPPTKILFK